MGNMGNTSTGQVARKRSKLRRLVGAGDRDRTDDIQLGKLTFYH
jgi:hypothetical protein